MQPNSNVNAPVRLAGRTLSDVRHICAFFHSEEERDKVLMPFLKEGFDRGEKIYQIVDANDRERHVAACQACGIGANGAADSGQVEVKVWEEAYLKDGCFDGDRMIGVLEEVVNGAREQYGLTRLVGNMEWACEALPGVHDIVEYEAKLNYILPKYPDPVVCVYDLNKHSGSVVMDILRTHPMVIIGGVLQENPLYVPPDEFLEELKKRKNRASAEETLN
jgi:hypothetical protein